MKIQIDMQRRCSITTKSAFFDICEVVREKNGCYVIRYVTEGKVCHEEVPFGDIKSVQYMS